MSLLERDTVMVSTDEEGNAVVDLPHTRANNVEGLGRSFNTYYSVGNVVYVDSNLSVALKCTKAGTTSNTELDISGNNIGDTVTDGSVVWKVCNRTSDVTSVNGQTGDVIVEVGVTSVNGQSGDVTVGKIVDASISGRVITLTFADGTTKTLTTQDTVGGGSTVSVTAGIIDYSGTIPLPSGYSRSQCKYAVWIDGNKSFDMPSSFSYKLTVNQSTGEIGGHLNGNIVRTVGYLCVAVK